MSKELFKSELVKTMYVRGLEDDQCSWCWEDQFVFRSDEINFPLDNGWLVFKTKRENHSSIIKEIIIKKYTNLALSKKLL